MSQPTFPFVVNNDPCITGVLFNTARAPFDKVDVLADMRLRGIDESFSKTILQNIKVLSTGQIWEQKGGESKPTVVNTVTMEVTPEQGEILNLASNEGKIRLLLRSRRNETTVDTPGAVTSGLFAGLKKEEPKQPKKEVKEKEEKTVEMIKGLDRSKASL